MVGRMRRESARVLRSLLESYQRPVSVEWTWLDRSDGLLGNLRAQAGIPTPVLRRLGVLAIVFGCVGFCLGGVAVGGSVIVIGTVGIGLRVWRRARANRQAVDRDLPALLTSVASSVRAGVDPVSALLAARDYFPKETPIVREIETLQRGLANGGDEEELLEAFLTIYSSQEGELFKRCLILSRRHGSSLSDPLHRITRVVRQRQSFRRKVKAALAMHRMSAIGIALCAAAMGALQLAMNPHALGIAMHHPTGSVLLVGGTFLICSGVVWMMMMGREAATR